MTKWSGFKILITALLGLLVLSLVLYLFGIWSWIAAPYWTAWEAERHVTNGDDSAGSALAALSATQSAVVFGSLQLLATVLGTVAIYVALRHSGQQARAAVWELEPRVSALILSQGSNRKLKVENTGKVPLNDVKVHLIWTRDNMAEKEHFLETKKDIGALLEDKYLELLLQPDPSLNEALRSDSKPRIFIFCSLVLKSPFGALIERSFYFERNHQTKEYEAIAPERVPIA